MVTFETADRLKDAGFPQPAPKFGQIWHDEDQDTIAVVGAGDIWPNDDGGVFQLVWSVAKSSADGVFETNNVEMAKWAYCPTVDDLLLAIDNLCEDKFGLSPVLLWGRTHQAFRATNATKYRVQGETSAEALANYWLELKLKGLKAITGKAEPDED